MNELERRIADEIRREGIIPFSRFMERALYEPQLGYYENPSSTPGKSGDFYTSVSVGSLFGRLLAFQFSSWLRQLDATRPILLECGAQTGHLAYDILDYLRARPASLCDRLEYWIFEPSKTRREWQRSTLSEFAGKIKWIASWSEIPDNSLEGIIFSNELLDAFPCQCFAWSKATNSWTERGVTLDQDQFAWAKIPHPAGVERPCCPPELTPFLPDGFLAEISPAAAKWWAEAAAKFGRGWLLTADYGLSNEEFFAPHRTNGTLRAFRGHRTASDVLASAGEQDLTTDINFTTLIETGEQRGLKTQSYISQEKFLTQIAERWLREELNAFSEPSLRRQFQTLTHPQHLGRSFKILIQSASQNDFRRVKKDRSERIF